MSATTLAPVIVRAVRDEPSNINAETVVRNLLIDFQNEIEARPVKINFGKILEEYWAQGAERYNTRET